MADEPQFTSAAQLLGQQIAALCLCPSSHSAVTEDYSTSSSSAGILTPSSDDMNRPASKPFDGERTTSSTQNLADACHLSPGTVMQESSRIHFGQPDNPFRSRGQSPGFTLRTPHSRSPQPCSVGEDLHASPCQVRHTRAASACPVLVTSDCDLPRAVHERYLDEKIVVSTEDGPFEPLGSSITTVPSYPSCDAASIPSRQSLPSLAHARSFELSPSPSTNSRRASDVSATSEVTEPLERYDVDIEELPPAKVFTQTYQTALQHGHNVAKGAVTAIEKLGEPSTFHTDLTRLHKSATEASSFESSELKTIAVLGDSGEGKSSLINSLLHFPDIAKTGDIGAACTSVVTEYRHKAMHHTAPITIEVEYLSDHEIDEQIKELLWKYRQLYLPNVDRDTVSAREYERYERESEQAWSALEAAFQHHSQFRRDFLSDTSEGGNDRVSQRLIQWAREIEWPAGGHAGKWMTTADTAEECYDQTNVFMSDKLWPFTKIIRVYLSARVLKTGIVLADLPGLQDTNLARVRATQMYLMTCDHVFIVAKISRAITDQSLKSSLYGVLARHVPLEWEVSGASKMKVAVVCTKSEDINEKTATREFCGNGKSISPSQIEQLDKEIARTQNSQLKKELKWQKKLLFINARNEHVKDGLQNAYAAKVPGRTLEVFCVSNKLYNKYTDRGDTTMVRASGIPELRRFCHTITADAQLHEANHYLKTSLGSLLSSLDLWADRPRNEAETVDPDVEALARADTSLAKAEILHEICDARQQFNNETRQEFQSYLLNRNRYWEENANQEARKWARWHFKTYQSWCRNEGSHQTAAQVYTDWNRNMVWKMRTELEGSWSSIEEDVPEFFLRLLRRIKLNLRTYRAALPAGPLFGRLSNGIAFRIQDAEYHTTRIQQKLLHDIEQIHRCASESNSCSYILEEMLPAYRSAAQESGRGMDARQKHIVSSRISNGTLFWHVSDRIKDELQKAIHTGFTSLHDAIKTIFDQVQDDISIALASREPMEGESSAMADEASMVELARSVKDLQKKHAEILDSIAD